MLVRIGKMAFASLLIGYLFYAGYLDLSLFGPLLTPWALFSGFLLTAVNLSLMAYRWFLLLRSRGFHVSYIESFKLFMIGIFFNYAIPGSIGGDVVKGYYLTQDFPDRKMEGAMSVVVDRILGLYSMVLLALASLILGGRDMWVDQKLMSISVVIIVLFGLMSLFLATAFSQRLSEWFAFERILGRFPGGAGLIKALQAVRAFGRSKVTILQSIGLSSIAQLVSVLFMMLVGQALGESIPFATYLFAVPLGFIFASIPVAPAGLGVGQVAFLMLFQLHMGRESMIGQTAITAFQLVTLIIALSGALFYMGRKPVVKEVLS